MNNHMPSYEELLIINSQHVERCTELEVIIHEPELLIDELYMASTIYRKLYMEFKIQQVIITKF